jgi:hypothetical protein
LNDDLKGFDRDRYKYYDELKKTKINKEKEEDLDVPLNVHQRPIPLKSN